MTWTLKPFTTSRWRPLLLVAGSLATLLAVGELRADDVSDPVVDFDSATLQAVTNLAIRMAVNSDGTRASPATVEDNVAAILAILQSFNSSGSSYLWNQPLYNDQYSLGEYLARVLTSGSFSAGRLPSASVSYFYQIQRALMGDAGVPSSPNSAVVPTLVRIESLLSASTNSASSSALNDILSSLLDVESVASRLAFDSSSGLGNLYVRDDALYDIMYDFKTSVDYSLYGIDQGVIGGFQDLRDALDDSATDNQNILSRLDSIIYNQQQQTEILSPSTDPYPPSPLTVPQSSDPEIASVAVAAPSTSALQNSFDGFSQSGTPVVEFWKDVTLLGYSIPDASIDLSEGVLGRCVTVMGKISRTLWYVLYYGLLATLLRREYVYYTSLGHTEGAA